jgi:uncharacterized protein (DUF697 family)
MKNPISVVGNVNEVANMAKRAQILKQTKDMDKEKRKKAAAIIHGASAATAAVGGGLAQLPGSDAAVIVPIQIAMVISLGKVFDRPLKEGAAKGIVAETTATMVGRAASGFLVGWIPVAGNAINATTAAAITEFLGWIIANEFSASTVKAVEAAIDADIADDGIINSSAKETLDARTIASIFKAVKAAGKK